MQLVGCVASCSLKYMHDEAGYIVHLVLKLHGSNTTCCRQNPVPPLDAHMHHCGLYMDLPHYNDLVQPPNAHASRFSLTSGLLNAVIVQGLSLVS